MRSPPLCQRELLVHSATFARMQRPCPYQEKGHHSADDKQQEFTQEVWFHQLLSTHEPPPICTLIFPQRARKHDPVTPSIRGSLYLANISGVFSLELCLPFLERVHGSVEVFQICTILSHQVFGTFQQFFRGWTVGRHSGCKYTPLRIQSARKDRHAECPTVRC